MIIPEAVVVSAADGSITTRSAIGLMFNAIVILNILVSVLFLWFQKLCQTYFLTNLLKIKMPALTGWHYIIYVAKIILQYLLVLFLV